MNILALDTCTELCSVALLYQGELYQHNQMTERGHSDMVLSMMTALLDEAGATIADVDVIAFGRGPGSFTGVRIGVGVAQGIAYARNIPVVGISTLAAVAQTAVDKLTTDRVAVAMDARMGEIYCASYQSQNGLVSLVDEERVCSAEQFKPYSNEKWLGVGTAWRDYHQALSVNFAMTDSDYFTDFYPHAASIIKLAEKQVELGATVSADQALPVYLRNNVAKKKAQQ